MKDLAAWFERQADRERRAVGLDDALLAGRFAEYARYRLRLFFLRYLATVAVHTVRVVLLAAVFSRATFLHLLIAEAAVGFTSSFWWGALETMRARVRQLHRDGSVRAVPREIERWLAVSWALAAVTMVGCIVWLGWITGAGRRGLDPATLYGLALFVRLALQFVTRTFHSGAYALRRIYRPAWAVVGLELVAFGAVLLTWPVFGAWALPAGTLAAGIAGSGLTIHFTRRLYQFMGFAPRWRPGGGRGGRWRASWRGLVAGGLSFAVMKLDAVLVFGLFGSSAVTDSGIELVVLLFVLSPTVQAGFDWAQLFYFDLKRLDAPALAPLLEQYRRYVSRLAWVLGLVFWAFASLIGTIVYLRSLAELYWLLGPFFVSRSLVASAQMQAFCARRHGALLGTACFWLVGFAAARRLDGDSLKLAVVVLATIAVYVALSRVGHRSHGPRERWVGILEWLARLSRTAGPVRIQSARVWRPRRGRDRRDPWRGPRCALRQAARVIAARLGSGGAVTVLPPDRLVWFDPAGTAGVGPDTLAALTGGAARVIHETRGCGPSAALEAWSQHGFAAIFGDIPGDAARGMSPDALERAFASMFPGGVVLRPGRADRSARAPGRRPRIIAQASRYLTDLRPPRPGSRVEVTALCDAGRLRLVFVAPGTGRSSARRRWRTIIREANVMAAVGAPAGA